MHNTMNTLTPPFPLPRITIQFCTQCKWMLRAAYFAQELLSTFSTDIGEVALQPSTGGTFIVSLYHAGKNDNAEGGKEENGEVKIQKHVIWDRKVEGGFPETKELKKRVRNIIDPTRDLGHVDGKKSTPSSSSSSSNPSTTTITTTNTANQSTSTSSPPQPQPQTPSSTPNKAEPKAEEEVLNSRGKIAITGEGDSFGYCRPGDEDCGGF
ncbi:hypothetical protein ACMFMG_010170 [Clarireedia jacksonii]